MMKLKVVLAGSVVAAHLSGVAVGVGMVYDLWPVTVAGIAGLLAVSAVVGQLITGLMRQETPSHESPTRVEDHVLAEVLDLIPYFIFAKDRDGRFLLVNKPFAAMFNMTPADMIGRDYAEMAIDKDDEQFVTGTDQQVIETGQPMSFEESYTDINGQRHYLITNKTRCMINGQVASLACCTDITERRKLEAQLQQSQKMHAVGQLAGGVAHDFNNLLQVILGYGEIVRGSLDREDARHGHMDYVMDAGTRAQALVHQLLAFSRRDQGVVLRPISLSAAVEGFMRMLREMLGPEIRLSFENRDARCCIRADLGQIEQVLMNLCVNARDAMGEGGELKIEISRSYLDRRDVKASPRAVPGAYVCLRVSDTGCGMAEEVREHAFEPFYSTKDHGKGTGLGLATVYAIIERHGGVIRMQSEPGKGTTFWIYIPASEWDAGDVAADALPSV